MAEDKKTKANALKRYDMAAPAEVAKMATVLKKHIVSQNLFTNIAGKNYAHVEGWQFAGGLLGIIPRIRKVEKLDTNGNEKAWLCKVDLIDTKTDKVVGYGVAMCSSAESKKRTFDEYAILSMAQTRAIGKAYRNLLGWVMKLAGYEGTPKEEMSKVSGEVVEEVPKRAVKKENVVDTGLDTDYTQKLKEEVRKMAGKPKMTNADILAFINKKLDMNLKRIASKGSAQILLAQLQEKK